MKTLSFNEMEIVSAGGCGWLKRASRRAERDGFKGAALQYAQLWVTCKML